MSELACGIHCRLTITENNIVVLRVQHVSATSEVGVQQGSLACRLLVHSQEIGLMGSRIEGTKVDLTERRELTANTIAIAYKSGPASS